MKYMKYNAKHRPYRKWSQIKLQECIIIIYE
jgi:hypothetical protein